jgi:hypothetical protein
VRVSYPATSIKYMFDTSVITVGGSGASASAPQDGQPLEVLESEICHLAGHLAASTCRFLVLLAEFDAREGWRDWDMPSCAAWLSWKCQMGSGTAREHVRVARALDALPVIRGEFTAGRFSYAKVRALTRIATPESDADLAEMAGPMTANQLDRFARAHRTVTEAEDEQVRLRRRLTWRLDDDGCLCLSVRLPPEDGAAVLTALRAVSEGGPPDPSADALADAPTGQPDVPAGTPTSTSLADALVEIAEAYISGRASEAANPDTYQVIVHADSAALAGDPTGRCHIQDGPAISTSSLRQLCCDAVLSWIGKDDRGNILQAGRRRRVPSPALRRALLTRDRGRCRFPGCHHRRTDAHHIIWWLHGGDTCLDNLVSLCRRHHRLIHKHGYQVKVTGPGQFTFHRPDGHLIINSPSLPEPRGPLDHTHDAEITPGTIVPPWYGERLDLDYAIATLFGNQKVRQARR